MTIFEVKGASDDKNEYNLFYGKYGFEYFLIKHVFRREPYFRG